MQTQKPNVINFTEFFRGEERDVYAMNLGNTQVVLEIESSPGGPRIPVLIPRTRDPYCLTNYVTYDAVKRCPDLRRLCMRRPPLLRLMTQEEFQAYYEEKARRFNTSVEEEIEKALELQSNIQDKKAVVSESESERLKTIDAMREAAMNDPEMVAELQPIARVVGLCSQAGPEIEDGKKISAQEMLAELEMLEADMRPTDFEYVVAHGYYKAVKKWASARMSTSEAE